MLRQWDIESLGPKFAEALFDYDTFQNTYGQILARDIIELYKISKDEIEINKLLEYGIIEIPSDIPEIFENLKLNLDMHVWIINAVKSLKFNKIP